MEFPFGKEKAPQKRGCSWSGEKLICVAAAQPVRDMPPGTGFAHGQSSHETW